ncbi:MAG: hypothetical protein HY747_07695 [Elusimicrobia bacterium]|nr:hypothetical protein [Elusimicrobiota bacterium]
MTSYILIAALSLLVALLSGYTAVYRYGKISQKPQLPEIMPVKKQQAAPKAKENPSKEPRVIVTPQNKQPPEPPPALDIEKAKDVQEVITLLPRNILFTYVNYRAKKVELAGDFNNWQPQAMSKEKFGVWRIRIPAVPGTYKYNFISDGKKTTDRYNPRREGGSSIIVIEPAEGKR